MCIFSVCILCSAFVLHRSLGQSEAVSWNRSLHQILSSSDLIMLKKLVVALNNLNVVSKEYLRIPFQWNQSHKEQINECKGFFLLYQIFAKSTHIKYKNNTNITQSLTAHISRNYIYTSLYITPCVYLWP